jgi:predicted permease
MPWMKRFGSIIRRRQMERELDDELQHHIALKTQENVEAGMTPERARYAALRAFGALEQQKEACRDVDRLRLIEDLVQDMRFGLRQLRRNPGFTLVAVITLALGIGANTAIFSLADVFIFRPLPVKGAARLTVVASQGKADSEPGQVSYLDYLDYRAGSSTVYSGMTAYDMQLVGLSYQGRADRVLVSYVPSNFFGMLGIRPALGRLIHPGEGDASKTAPVIVLGHSYWERRFGGDPKVIGRTVSLDGTAVTIIGVVTKAFHGPYNTVDVDAYLPIGMVAFISPSDLTARGDRDVRVLATLRPAVGIQQAQAALNVIAERLEHEYPQADQGVRIRVFPERITRPEPAAADFMPLVAGVFLVMVGLVLVVACLNVANLLLARATAREKELSVRAALGAGGKRLLRQLLTESMLLALAGAASGAIAGNWLCHLLNGMRPMGDIPLRLAFGFDWRVFAYVAAVALVAGIVAGLAPGWRVLRADLNVVLREGGRGLIGESSGHWIRDGLVVAQVAGSLVVLVAAGLFTRSLVRAESVDLGFDPHHILNIGLDAKLQGYDQARGEAFFRELLRRARMLPGVESAALAYSSPLFYYNDGSSVYAQGQARPPKEQVPGAGLNRVSTDYFTTLRIRILKGRAFTDADTAKSEPVAIINQTMAARLWPHRDAVGQRFSCQTASGPWVTVVGVVNDAQYTGLLDPPGMYFYVPQAQDYNSIHVLQLRTSVPPGSLASTVERLVHQLDPNMPVYDVMAMEQVLQGANGFFIYKMGAAFAGVLGALCLLLAVVGVYGVVSYTVSGRHHEIGIRMALGARRRTIFGLVIRQAAILVGAGAGIGVLLALAATRVLTSLLVGVSSYDPVTYVSVAGLLMAAALLASYIPARRATKVDPMLVLRYE